MMQEPLRVALGYQNLKKDRRWTLYPKIMVEAVAQSIIDSPVPGQEQAPNSFARNEPVRKQKDHAIVDAGLRSDGVIVLAAVLDGKARRWL